MWRLVLCIETDDFACPRGVAVGEDADFQFHVGTIGKVSEGSLYAVSEAEPWKVLKLDYFLLPDYLRTWVDAWRSHLQKNCLGAPPWLRTHDV